MDRILVFDIETVPNPELVEALSHPSHETGSEEQAKWMATHAPFLKVVLIGCLSSRDGKATSHRIEGYRGEDDDGEAKALEAFWKLAAEHEFFVTFSGMHFDVPILAFRSRVHRVKMPIRISTYPYGDPEKEKHFDLQRVAFGEHTKGGNLGNLAVALGIKDTETGSGADVRHWVRKGEWDRLWQYNYNDIRLTAAAFEILFAEGSPLGFLDLSVKAPSRALRKAR